MSEAEIEAHNRRTLWQDVADHLAAAVNSIEQVQGALEDLGKKQSADEFGSLARDLRAQLARIETY